MESEAYLEPFRISAMELKSLILDVLLGSKYTSVSIYPSWSFLRENDTKLMITLKARNIRHARYQK